jgi:hypothetical protein
MQGKEFLAVALKLAQMRSEAAIRSAVSRTYYAVFNVGRQLLNDLGFVLPNADEPQPKRSLTELNSHGRDFHEFISVRVLFREPDFFAFFAKISLVTD